MRATCAISTTSCTRTMWAPPRMLAVTVAAVAQMRWSGGTVFVFVRARPCCARAKVRPRNPLREVPTSSG